MSTAKQRVDVRHEILRRHPELGYAATADSIAAGGIVHVARFGHSRLGGETYDGMFMYLPGESGNNRLKVSTTTNTSTGTLAHGSASNYSGTSTTAYEIWGPMDPDEANDCIARALRSIPFYTHLPLLVGEDDDMALTGVDYWDGTLGSSEKTGMTITKVTTASSVLGLLQALNLAVSSATNYTRGRKHRVFPGQRLRTSVLAKADTGSFYFDMYDATNGATFGTRVSYTGEAWARLHREDVVPAGCYEVQTQFSGAAASDSLQVASLHGPYPQGLGQLLLPATYADEFWKLRAVRIARYAQTIATGVDAAYSRFWEADLVQPTHFALETAHREANPYRVTFTKEGMDLVEKLDGDLWMLCERPWSDVDFTPGSTPTESTTSEAPFEQWVNESCKEIFTVLHNLNKDDEGNSRWLGTLRHYDKEVALDVVARPAPPAQPAREDFFFSV